LLKGYKNLGDLSGKGGTLKQLTKALMERCLEAEMKTHIEEQRSQTEVPKSRNRRNGHSKKTITGELREAAISIGEKFIELRVIQRP